jgi:hypothetical protein
LAFVPDPDPVSFPRTVVLEILNAVATDDTFSVPAATGCGPQGVADDAINSLLGLPSPSGNNHLVLNGNSLFADDFSDGNQANELLAAFHVSAKAAPAPTTTTSSTTTTTMASPSGAFLD